MADLTLKEVLPNSNAVVVVNLEKLFSTIPSQLLKDLLAELRFFKDIYYPDGSSAHVSVKDGIIEFVLPQTDLVKESLPTETDYTVIDELPKPRVEVVAEVEKG